MMGVCYIKIQAKIELYEMIDLWERNAQPYYVYNDFFNNKYNLATKLRYSY